MAETKIIAVVGATGAQGGGLVRAIVSDSSGEFKARALTRNLNSDKARELSSMGVEVVAADQDDVGSLKDAFAGAYGVYAVTNFWEHLDPERETTQARNQAEAASVAGVRHAIWSSLEDTRRWVPLDDDRMPTLMGKYKVPHFDAKGEANQTFEDLVPATILQTSFYWDNLHRMGVKPGPDGVRALTFPMGNALLPGIAAEDIGKTAFGIFRRGEELIGRTISISGENLRIEEMAAKISNAIGREVRYKHVPPDVFRSFPFPGADESGNMFQFKRDFNDYYAGVRDQEFARSLNPELQSFDEWLARNASRIPLE